MQVGKYVIKSPFGWIGWGVVLILFSAVMYPLHIPNVAKWIFEAGLLFVAIGALDSYVNRS